VPTYPIKKKPTSTCLAANLTLGIDLPVSLQTFLFLKD